MLRRLPLHPVLVGAFPVLLLWALNASEVWPAEVWPVLSATIGVSAALVVVGTLVMRDLTRGALVASAITALALGHGHLWGDGWVARVPGMIVALAAVAWVVRAATRADERSILAATGLANLVAGLLVLGTMPAIVGALRAVGDIGPITVTAANASGSSGAPGDEPLRDIVWVVPDRYGGQDGLGSTFGIDNGPFVAALEQRGFAVADDARANYPRTSHSLAAQLNLEYLDELAAEVPDEAQDDVTPLYRLLRDHAVGRLLTEAGYEYVHIGSWWGPTATADSADRIRVYDPTSEFAAVFERTTVLPALGLAGGDAEEDVDWRSSIRASTAWQLDALDEEAARIVADLTDPPRFVFVHLPLPHEPYVFDTDGSMVPAEVEDGRDRSENYGRQLSYLNARLLALADVLGSVPEERAPIVLIQADEGPHPAELEFEGRSGFRWEDRPVDDLVTKLSILSAMRLPGRDGAALVPEDLTGVNAMRLVLDEYLGTDLGQLPNRSLIYPDEQTLYRFEDVTALLDEALAD